MKAFRFIRSIVLCLGMFCSTIICHNRCFAQTLSVPFAIGFYYPTNNEVFTGPTNIALHASVTDSNVVETMQYFSSTNLLGIITNKTGVLLTNTSTGNPFDFLWSNAPPGSYTLTAVATDSSGATATSGVVNIIVNSRPPPPPVPFVINFYYPTNGEVFMLPTNIYVHASVTDSNVVRTMQYFAGSNSLAIVTNTGSTLFTNISSGNPFAYFWTNPPPGSYTLTAVATDSTGATATSGVVTITVKSPPPPPPIPFAVGFYYPTNGETFIGPTNIGVHAWVTDSNVVETIQYFSGTNLIDTVTNKNGVLLTNTTSTSPFEFLWTNVPPGSYALTAVATDSAGATATSGVVNITVNSRPPPPPVPFVVAFYYPTNGEVFYGPTNIGVHALVTDSNVVKTVQYFSGSNSIGIVTNTGGVLLTNTSTGNPFFLLWSNVQPGSYVLTAVATDAAGATATSAPVNITVLSAPTNLPIVTIYAPDPVAFEGTNMYGGTNTATFLIRRDSGTNNSLTVYYAIGGMASNGVDYVLIPNNLTLSPGQRYGLITILPLQDNDVSNRYETVILTLTQPPGVTNITNETYQIGNPSSAGAVILEENVLPIVKPFVHNFVDGSVHVSLPATNGMNFCLQISTDFVNWTTLCTNTVLKGSAQFVDPDCTVSSGTLYRIVPASGPASY